MPNITSPRMPPPTTNETNNNTKAVITLNPGESTVMTQGLATATMSASAEASLPLPTFHCNSPPSSAIASDVVVKNEPLVDTIMPFSCIGESPTFLQTPITQIQLINWRKAFYVKVDQQIKSRKKGCNILSFNKYNLIKSFINEVTPGVTLDRWRQLKRQNPQSNELFQKYGIIHLPGKGEDGGILVYKPQKSSMGANQSLALDRYKQVKHYENAFEALCRLHLVEGKEHPRSRSLYSLSKKEHGQSIPRFFAQALGDTCPICIFRHKQRLQPSLTEQYITAQCMLDISHDRGSVTL